MLISLNWIKDFVSLPDLTPKELASRFTLTTAEVEDVLVKGAALKPILCVEIKSLRPHPDSDKLNLVTFDYGQGQLKEVVCGAPNVRVGLRVPYAPIGTTLPNGMTLEPKKIRGILSDGMLCSEAELGLEGGKGGLMELTADAISGTPLPDYLKLESDVILDVDNKSLTHRPDLWGYLGLAREFAAGHRIPLVNRFDSSWEKRIQSRFTTDPAPVGVEVSGDSSCWAYYGLSLDIPRMTETPSIIRTRLEAAGLRSINLIVDLSNYAMVELGIPNHIFDRSKISGSRVFIRRASPELRFTTLDGQERELTAADTVIFDADRPLVIAGLMGGLESGVTPETTKLFVEVANWEAPEVRKTSVRLGLRTDSSQRYEKTLDSNQCYRTLLRLVELITEHCPGATVIGSPTKYLREEALAKPLSLTITRSEINRSLGMEVPTETVRDIFERLDFKVNETNGSFLVTVPTYRTTKDISVKADLIEEIGRMIGFDNITPVSPMLPVKPVRLSSAKQFHRRIQDFLVMQGKALQVMTYPLVGKELLTRALWPEANESLMLVNALSVEQDRMRPSMIPSAIEVAAHNQKHYEDFAFFELGRSYLGFQKERSQLLIAMYSKKSSRFVELENLVEKLFGLLNIGFTFGPHNPKFPNAVLPAAWNGAHPNEYLNIQVMGKYAGVINSVHPLILKNFKMKGHLSLAVIDLTDVESKEIKDKTKYRQISKFPTSSFDVTVVMNKDLPAASVMTALSSLKQKEIKSKAIVDVYHMSEDQKSVSVRTVFEDSEKTLTAETIKDLEQNVIQALERAGFPVKC